jgi:hypothetical protein
MKKFILLFFALAFNYFNSSAQWTNGGTQLTFTPTQDVNPRISPTSDGGYYMICVSDTFPNNPNGPYYVKLNAYDSSGLVRTGWKSGGIYISSPGSFYDYAHVITSEDGNAIVSWYGNDTSSLSKGQNIYVQKYSSAGAPIWNGGTTIILNNSNHQNDMYPMMITDGKKGVFIAWTKFPNSPDSSNVYLQHLDSTGNIASGWNIDGVEVAAQPYMQMYPHLALTKDLSSIYVVYASYPDSTHFILNKYNTSDGSHGTGWLYPNGVTIAKGSVLYPRNDCNLWIYTDSLADASVFWLDSPYSYGVENWVAFMNQVSSNGNPKNASPKYVAGGPIGGNGIDYLEVKQDKDYNLLIAFNDHNGTTGTEIYVDAYKVTPAGAILWSKTDIASEDDTYCPKAISDGKGGMYVFYEDISPSGYYNLHVMALDSTGKIYPAGAWAAPGPNFGSGSNTGGGDPNYDFSVAQEPGQKAIVAWNKATVTFDTSYVFSCNVMNNGGICGQTPISTSTGKVEMNNQNCIIYPNPFENYTTVMLNSNLTGDNILKLFDLSGKVVNEYKLSAGGENNINTSQLAQGMYFYQLINNNQLIQNGKLIKQ